MPRTPRWKEHPVTNGAVLIELSSWKYFHDYVYQEMLDFSHYVWRGHRCDHWLLESTLDRALKQVPNSKQTKTRATHLEKFKMAVRGRRGSNPRHIESENDW